MRRQVLSAAAAGSAAFETSGVLQLSKPLEVFFKDNNNQTRIVSGPRMHQVLLPFAAAVCLHDSSGDSATQETALPKASPTHSDFSLLVTY